MESLKNSVAELNWNQKMQRNSIEIAEDGGGSVGNRDFTERRVGTERIGLWAGGQRYQQAERQEEVGWRKQGTAETAEKDRREHLLQCSGSQGGGQGC